MNSDLDGIIEKYLQSAEGKTKLAQSMINIIKRRIYSGEPRIWITIT